MKSACVRAPLLQIKEWNYWKSVHGFCKTLFMHKSAVSPFHGLYFESNGVWNGYDESKYNFSQTDFGAFTARF